MGAEIVAAALSAQAAAAGINRPSASAQSRNGRAPVAGCDAPRLRHVPIRCAPGGVFRTAPQIASTPAARSRRQTAISGRPINAVGSSLPIRSNSAMPRPSHLKLPAQSSGCSRST